MVRSTVFAALVFLTMPSIVHAQWKLRQEYTDGKLTMVSVSSESQVMPVGMRDSYSASLSISCYPEAQNMWVQLIWPERMTGMKTITIVRTAEGVPQLPQEWQASDSNDYLQSFTLDTLSLAGTEFMNRLLTNRGKTISLSPQGNGRIQDGNFTLEGLEPKLREVTRACPKWSYFDAMNLKK